MLIKCFNQSYICVVYKLSIKYLIEVYSEPKSVFASHKSEFAYIHYICFVLFFQLVGQATNRAVFMPVLSQGRLPADICYSIRLSDTMQFRFDWEIV